jgi:hypothetical protein
MNNNKLIAEFMEFPTHTDAVDDRTIAYYVGESIMHTDNTENENDCDVFHPDDMQFHTSWDWLMPVVEKIEQVNEGVPIQLLNISLFSSMDEVYKAVIEFIESYE